MEHGFEHNALPGSLELAYLGDTIYDLYVRSRLVRRGGRVQNMHREAIKQVCCHAQAQALGRIEGELSEIEAGVVRRARNAHQNPPKNASPAEYPRATAASASVRWDSMRPKASACAWAHTSVTASRCILCTLPPLRTSRRRT